MQQMKRERDKTTGKQNLKKEKKTKNVMREKVEREREPTRNRNK